MNQENTPWQYKPDEGSIANSTTTSDETATEKTSHKQVSKTIAWEAAEYIEHQRGLGWYVGLFVTTVGLAAGAYFLAKDIMSVAIIILVGAIIFVFASQKPGRAKYEINHSGISINGKLYRYSNYKSFAIIQEGNMLSLNLFPLKRFLPPLSAYFEPEDEKKIMNTMGSYLPYEDRQLDALDRLARRLRL